MMMSLLVVMIVMALMVSSVTSLPGNIENQELGVAIQEMESANYFTFVMLMNMDLFDPRLQNNITFLMPNDRMLSKVMLPQHSVTDFLLLHSIPSALPLEYLEAMPTGSAIPSSKPDYILRLRVSNDNNNSNGTNGGSGNLFLNNVKIIRPNICRGGAGSSIRCHGIDGVLAPLIPLPAPPPPVTPAAVNNNSTCSRPTPEPDPISSGLNPKPVSSSASPPTPTPTNTNNNIDVNVAPTAPTKSAASSLFLSHGGLFRMSFTCAIFLSINSLSSTLL